MCVCHRTKRENSIDLTSWRRRCHLPEELWLHGHVPINSRSFFSFSLPPSSMLSHWEAFLCPVYRKGKAARNRSSFFPPLDRHYYCHAAKHLGIEHLLIWKRASVHASELAAILVFTRSHRPR